MMSLRLPVALRQLPPLPQALTRALQIIQDPLSQRSDLADVLSLDQGLTGLFLRMVNSAYYGLPRRITSLNEAIGYLGYETVESIILAVSVSKVLSRPVPAYLLESGALWQHSVAVASGAEWIARYRRLGAASEFYVAGLLHDVGKLALDAMQSGQVQWDNEGDEQPPIQDWTKVERMKTGHDHAEVGAIVVRSWNLPDRVVEAVACHHNPGQATLDPQFTAVVHVANAAALMAGIGIGVDGLRYPLDDAAFDLLAWQEADMANLMGEMRGAVAKAEEILGMKGS